MIIYGKQTVLYCIEHFADKINTLYISKDLDKKLYNKIMHNDFEVKRTKPEHAQQLAKSGNHQGFLADIQDIEPLGIAAVKPMNRILVLAGLTDMGNIGAIIRSSFALGVEAIVIAGVQNIQLEQLARSSSGALFSIPIIHEPNLMDIPNTLKQFEFTLYGAAMDGNDVRNEKFDEKTALFVGSEGSGLPTKLENKLDKTVSIAMHHSFDSLNVSVATAILIDRMR